MGKTILFHPLSEGGHFFPTLRTARKLRDRGDRVIYLSELSLLKRVEEEGFECVPYLASVYGAEASAEASMEWHIEKDANMWREMASGRLEAQLAEFDVDLVLYDVTRFHTGLLAHKMGIPCIRVSTSFSTAPDLVIPPLWSDALPGDMSPQELSDEWHAYHVSNWQRPFIKTKKLIEDREFFAGIEACGVQLGQVRIGAMSHIIDGDPELILSSSLWDFREARGRARTCYAGPCLSEPESAEWSSPTRRAGAPLILCAFGGQSGNYRRVSKFLEALMETCTARPGIDLVLAAPDSLVGHLKIPASVEHLSWAPQRAILRQADLFITHGGQSSVKEAIWDGVPMLVCPQAYDQHGNAARVAYHQLGLRVLEDSPSVEGIGDAMDQLLADPSYKVRVQEMGRRFRTEAEDDADLRFIDQIMSSERDTTVVDRLRELEGLYDKNFWGA